MTCPPVPDRALQLIRARRFEQAAGILAAVAAEDTTGESDALLGLTCFQRGQYREAQTHYETALAKKPREPNWLEMRNRAEGNAVSQIDQWVPGFYLFQRQRLLAAPEAPPGDAATAPLKRPAHWWLGRLSVMTGNALGVAFTAAAQIVTELWGRIAGYHSSGVWTNWYRRRLTLAILTLSHMRNQLNRRNLKNTYPTGSLTGFFDPNGTVTPPADAAHFRTADGSWNNFADPKEGAAGTRFGRNVERSAIRPEQGDDLLTPNPRQISRILLTRKGGQMKEVPFLNLLAAAWIQFQNHDWVNHGELLPDDPIQIPLPKDDPARHAYQQDHMFVGRTQPDPTRMADIEQTPVTFINEVTHWWDGSQIYGSDWKTVTRLRSGRDGKLRIGPDGRLPLDRTGIEETGFTRNWWVGLAMLHTLFVREHNAICDHLKLYHPQWNDHRLFNVTRLINAAVMAKIHTVEWTPAILPNPALDMALNANWFGILTNLFRTGKHRRTVAKINIRNPELGGVVGNPIDKHGQPFALTEEFVEVYRLHPLLPEELHLRTMGDDNTDGYEPIPLSHTRQAGSAKLTDRVPLARLFYCFGNQHPGQLVLNNYPKFMQELSIPGNPMFDLGAVDILRARERGVPRYNEFRRQLGLKPIRSFDDLTNDPAQVRQIREVYGNDVEKLDLLIGTLAEGQENRPTGFGFGETLFQIFILNATRRLQADRFYTDNYNEQTYTREGLQWIDDTDFKTVLLRHYPELGATGLSNVKNAFEPWDTDQKLDPQRHPLRAYDKELAGDPWLGNAWR